MTRRDLVVGLIGAALALVIAAGGALKWFKADPKATESADSRSGTPVPAEPMETLQVHRITCYGPPTKLKDAPGTPTCELRGDLDVVLTYPASSWTGAGRLRDLSLVIGGIDFPHITARPIDDTKTTLKFTLDPDLDRAQWRRLFKSQDEEAKFTVALALPEETTAVGKTTELHFVSNAKDAYFDIRNDVSTSLIYAFLGLLAITLIGLAVWTPLLRDAGTGDTGPFSLARTQLALWTLVVVGSYLFLWTVLGAKNPLNQTGLILIGLSALTGLTATAVDTKNAAAGAAPKSKTSGGFWSDLLSDTDGFAISRLQMVIWTLVLAVVFGYSVWTDLAMPDYDTVLLGLLGVSNGTYVGLKLK